MALFDSITLEQAEEIYQGLQSWGLTSSEYQAKIEATFLDYLRPKMTWEEAFQPGVKYRFICSNCGNDEMYRTPFCPQCGAKEKRQ